MSNKDYFQYIIIKGYIHKIPTEKQIKLEDNAKKERNINEDKKE